MQYRSGAVEQELAQMSIAVFRDADQLSLPPCVVAVASVWRSASHRAVLSSERI